MIESENPAVVFINGIGDHFINLPGIRALADLFRGGLTLVCRTGAYAALFSEIPLRAVCKTDFVDTNRGRIFDTKIVTEALQGCDLLISLNPWHSEAMDQIIHNVAPKDLIGFFPTFTNCLALNCNKHSAELAFDVPRFFDPSLSIDTFSQAPRLPPLAIRGAMKVLDPLPPRWRILAVHGDSTEEKMWPPEKFARVLDPFLSSHEDFIVLLVGRRRLPVDCGRISKRVVPCYGLPLMTSVALVASADLFLGIDSCMLHVADIFRVPGVGLFGPTSPDEFGFRLAPHRHVWGRGTMSNIIVDQVLHCLERVISLQDACGKHATARTRSFRGLADTLPARDGWRVS
jgi:hypothetical protein